MKQVLTEKQLIDCQIEKRQLLKLRSVPQCYYYAIANIVWFINVAYISSITLIVMQYNICKLKQKDCLLNSTETECKCFGIKYNLLLKSTISFSYLNYLKLFVYSTRKLFPVYYFTPFSLYTLITCHTILEIPLNK